MLFLWAYLFIVREKLNFINGEYKLYIYIYNFIKAKNRGTKSYETEKSERYQMHAKLMGLI